MKDEQKLATVVTSQATWDALALLDKAEGSMIGMGVPSNAEAAIDLRKAQEAICTLLDSISNFKNQNGFFS